jgi:DNA gyrase subunit A
MTLAVEPVSLHEAAYERYLSYALSVITSRALPDVRDGLKPVQRRILYTMFHELSLHPTGRYTKCAAVVGDVMGKYHPHGDSSIYEALVRMAQSFSLRAPLVDGQGNFGSLDGDPAAAMRYTECKLRPIAEELLTELGKETVDHQATYDGQRLEPVVLPAQFPQLLVNGVEGIAVGMATKIPPHHLGEVVDACIALIDHRELPLEALLKHIRGPDFPTGGRVLATRDELLQIYAAGQGTIKVQGTWDVEKDGRKRLLVIQSIPYGQNKAKILEKIGADVEQRKLPQVTDVRDESTDDVRIVLELKQDASAEQAMAYLYKHTDLEAGFSVNLTVLVPTDRADLARPERLDLKTALCYWLDFRFTTVRRRFEYELRQLRERIHILDGFRKIFDALDETIVIIRKSDGKRDAAEKLMARFGLDELQTDAILELKLYRLARLEIRIIVEELEDKLARAAEIERILASDAEVWTVVKRELLELKRLYADKRRTQIGAPAQELAYDAEADSVKEDATVVVTRDGWIKRQSSFTQLDKIRVREGDSVGWLFRANTRSTLTFFSDQGGAYVMRVDDIPATTGHGEPVQRHFAFSDGEKIIGVLSNDPRNRTVVDPAAPVGEEDPPPPYAVAFTRGGRAMRFPLAGHEEVSTKNGRRYARLDEQDRVYAVLPSPGADRVSVATRKGRAMVFPTAEIPVLRAAGKGVTGIKLHEGDTLLAFDLVTDPTQGVLVVTEMGRDVLVSEDEFGLSERGAVGKVVLKRGSLVEWKNRRAVVQAGITQVEAATSTAPSDNGDAS